MGRLATVTLVVALVVVAGVAGSARSTRSAAAADCTRTSVGLTPLTELGSRTYHGARGGLYPGGRNAPSRAYLSRAVAAAKQVKPVDGSIVLLTIGMSNVRIESDALIDVAEGEPRVAAKIVNGAEGGQDAIAIQDSDAPYWRYVDQRLQDAGATATQVGAVWLKEAIAREDARFPLDAQRLRASLRRILGILDVRFPNLKLVYVSSRIYAGYATTNQNPEPVAYDSGFAVKWFVGDRIDGHVGGPLVLWAPYLWADGTKARRDGLTWRCPEFRDDGTHPSATGAAKVARMLLSFFETNTTTRPWFLRPS